MATTTAPVAPSGFARESNDTKKVCPLASSAVKPGAAPALFSRVRVHFAGAGAGPATGPRTTSSTVSARLPMRFVNHPESGTSSIVLTFPARMPAGS